MLNAKQLEIKKLHETVGGFDLEEALEKFASKPKGRPPKSAQAPTKNINTVDSVYREGRLLLEHLENANAPVIRKNCLECGQDFLSNYKFVALCSDSCRATRFAKKYGFVWDAERSEAERWGLWSVPPSIISPATLKKLEAFARSLLGIEPTPKDAALSKRAVRSDANNESGIHHCDERIERSEEGILQERVPEQASKGNSVGCSDGTASFTKVESGSSQGNDGAGSHNSTAATVNGAVGNGVTGNTPAEVKANFRAGLITAHELQVQLAALYR